MTKKTTERRNYGSVSIDPVTIDDTGITLVATLHFGAFAGIEKEMGNPVPPILTVRDSAGEIVGGDPIELSEGVDENEWRVDGVLTGQFVSGETYSVTVDVAYMLTITGLSMYGATHETAE